MGLKIDLIGKKFNRWTVLRDCGKVKHGQHSRWFCRCECGNTKEVSGKELRNSKSKSCGCYQKEIAAQVNTTHGYSIAGKQRTPEYESWAGMKDRCYNKKDAKYNDYGGRGITVCDGWLGENGFTNFLEDMGLKPSKYHSLDRFPNNDDNSVYEKSNCRWATDEQQARNRRSNVYLEYNGEKKLMVQWAQQFGTDQGNITHFLKIHTFDEAYIYYMNKKAKKLQQHNILLQQ